MFSNWPKCKKATFVFAILLLLFTATIVGLIAWVKAQYEADSLETGTIRELRMARYSWLDEGCPQPPTNYFIELPPNTNFTYSGTLVVSNHLYHGLFATRYGGWVTNYGHTNTFVITTTGDILLLEDSGQVKLLKTSNEW